MVNAPAWLGNVTWDLLAGTNQIRNLHATGPLSIQLTNDDWTLSFGCDAYTTQQTDDAISTALSDYFTRTEVTVTVVAAIDESKGYTDTQLADYSTTAEMTQAITDALVPYGTAVQRDAAIAAALAAYYTSAQTDAAIAAGLAPYSTTVQMNQAITDALVPFETAVQRDAAIAAALAAYYTSVQTDAAIAAAIAPYYTSAETDAAIAAAVALSNGQTWNGGPTFNLLRGGNVLRNLSVAGALTATFQTWMTPSSSNQTAMPAAKPTRSWRRAQRSPPPSTPWTCPNSRTRRRCWPSSPASWCPIGTRRKSRPTWRASWPTTPPAAR